MYKKLNELKEYEEKVHQWNKVSEWKVYKWKVYKENADKWKKTY